MNPREIPACQYHDLCGGWCEAPDQMEAGLCEHCMEADLQEECERARSQQRVAVALRHVEELAEHAPGDSQAKIVALALVNQLVTLGHLNAKSAQPYLVRIHSLRESASHRDH